MFILKAIIILVILFFILFNAVSIIANNTLPTSEKMLGLGIFFVIIIVGINLVSSFITYYHTKYKKGVVGDPGISGRIGDKGDTGACNKSCGKKICYKNIVDNANKILVTEYISLRNKIEGTPTTSSSELTTSSGNGKKEVPKPTYKALETCDSTTPASGTSSATATIENTDIPVFRDISKLKIRNKFFLNKLNKICHSKKYTEILERQHKNKPSEQKLINYITSIVDKWIVLLIKFKVGVTEGKLYKGYKVSINPTWINYDSYRDEIQNESFYIDTIIPAEDGEPEMYRLVPETQDNNVVTTTPTGKKEIRTMSFTRTDLKMVKTMYPGLNFLLTEEANLDYLTMYDSEDVDSPKSPLEIIKKYDIWNFAENYEMIPLVVEKCIGSSTTPRGNDPALFVVYTNNYEKVYDTNTREDEWYSSNTYCQNEQMGDDKTNPNNLKTCLYYKTNDQGHSYLKGSQTAFKKTEHLNKNEISLYHPKKQWFTIKNDITGNEEKISAYYIDKYNRRYFPVGSVWTAKNDTKRDKANNFNPHTNNQCSGHNAIGPQKETILVSGNLRPPIDYKLKWKSKEGCEQCQPDGPLYDISIWSPIAPTGYVTLGDYAKTGKEKPFIASTEQEALHTPIMCVPLDCAMAIPIGKKVWDSQYLIRKEYINDEDIEGKEDSDQIKIETERNLNYTSYKNMFKKDVIATAPRCNLKCPVGMVTDKVKCECYPKSSCNLNCTGNFRPNYNTCKCECNLTCDELSMPNYKTCKCEGKYTGTISVWEH